jgi:hypothetical protein
VSPDCTVPTRATGIRSHAVTARLLHFVSPIGTVFHVEISPHDA